MGTAEVADGEVSLDVLDAIREAGLGDDLAPDRGAARQVEHRGIQGRVTLAELRREPAMAARDVEQAGRLGAAGAARAPPPAPTAAPARTDRVCRRASEGRPAACRGSRSSCRCARPAPCCPTTPSSRTRARCRSRCRCRMPDRTRAGRAWRSSTWLRRGRHGRSPPASRAAAACPRARDRARSPARPPSREPWTSRLKTPSRTPAITARAAVGM